MILEEKSGEGDTSQRPVISHFSDFREQTSGSQSLVFDLLGGFELLLSTKEKIPPSLQFTREESAVRFIQSKLPYFAQLREGHIEQSAREQQG